MSYTPHKETDDETGIVLKIVADDDTSYLDPTQDDDAIIFAILHRRYANRAPKHLNLNTQEDITDFGAKNRTWAQFALYLYDHSGTTYRIGDEIKRKSDRSHNPFAGRLAQGHAEFDSGRVGSIFVKRSDVGRGKARKVAEQFCETYTDWANGNVYGYVIEDQDGEEIDSCWGFIGDYDGYIMEQAREAYQRAIAGARETAASEATARLDDFVDAYEAERPDLYDGAHI